MYKIVAFCRWIYYFREDYSIDIEEIRRELGEEFILDIKNYTGKITDVFSSYCIIDSAIYLSFLSIPKSNHLNRSPRVGDYVSLKLQRVNENEEYQVLEFEKIWRRSWDDAEPEEEEKEEEGGMTRKEGGLVLSVQGGRMEVLINQEKRSLNLAQIWKENYLPVKGDQLLFSCRVEGDDSDFNGSKIVLAVPQRMKSGDGEVHAMRGKRGKISGDVFLDESVCNYKYAPRNRDNVRFHAVECVPTPATLDCIWRATSVSPKTIHKYFGRSALPPSQEKLDDQAALLSDKNGVEIRGEQSFGTLNFTETAELKLTIRNSNADSIELESIRFPGQVNSKSGTGIPGNQITWSGDSIIAAREVSEIRFKLRPGNIGKHDQLVVFNFKHFNIGRILCANVVSDRLERIFKNSGSSDFTSGTSTIIRVETQDNWVIKGNKRKRDQPPDYISNRLGGYPVPLYLFEKAEESDYSEEVVCIYPTLLIKLNQENYDSKLKALLYIEEVAATLELAQYSLEQVFLVRRGAFLTLTVPGLKERRPSLCLGDSVLLSDIKDPNMPVYEGCIEEVRSTELLLRFDENFQKRYDGELYNVTFKMNRGQYRRQHQCIESADRNLGFNILFPHTVIMKTPQVEFVVVNTSSSESSIRSSSQVKGKSSEIKVLSSKARFLQKLNILRKQKQDMPVLVEGEEKQDLPILVEGEKKQDLPFLVEGEEKQDLPLRVEEKVKQDLPVLVEGEEKQYLPLRVEEEVKQDLPILVEGEEKQGLPVLVEGEEKQGLSVLVEGGEKQGLPVLVEGEENQYLPVLVDGEEKQGLPVLVEGEEKQDLPVLVEGEEKQYLPVLVEGEEKQYLPVLVEGEEKQYLPVLVEGGEKQDLPLRVEEEVKQDLPVLVEGEEKQDLPVLVEGEEKQDLPVLVEGEEKQYLPFLVEGEKKQYPPFLVEGEEKQYLPVLMEGEEKQDLSVLMEGEEETEINLKEEDKDNKGNEEGKKGDITAKSAEEKEKVEKKDNLSTEETEGEERVEKKEGFTEEQTEGNKKVVEKKDDITKEDTEGEEKVKKKEDTAVKTEKEEKVGKKEDFKTEESKFEKKEVMSTKATKKVEKVKRTAGEKKKSSTYKKEEKESYEQSKKKGSDHSKIWVIPNVNKIRTEKIDDSFTFIPSLPFQFKYNRVSSSIPAYYPKQGSEPGILKLSWINPSLNPEQRSAVLRILTGEGRPLPYIIYGPPGTGKTVTLVEAVLQLFTMRSDVRILVATPSNSAADLVAERIIRSGKVQVGDLARLNSFQRSQDSIPELLLPYCLKNDEDESLLQSSKHKILVSTCGTVGSIYKLKLKHGHYSHVFVDEAGHMTEPECLVPLGLVHRETGQIVLAGDPQQLGPVIQSPIAALYGLELSLLERLSLLPVYLPDRERFRDHGGYDPLLVTKLVRNYRSHPDILLVPSRLFYENELIPCGAETKINKFINFNFLPSKGHPVIFHGVKGDNRQEPDSPSWFNPQEVWQVAVYTQNLLIEGVEKDDIGIISPYRKQTQKIREMLKVFNIDGIRIGSVEEFQGQEKPVILLTTTRSGTEHQVSDNKQGIGFLASPKRLNVAVTRAQSLLIVIGNPHVLSKDMNWFELLQHIVGLGGYTGCDLPITLQ